MQLFRFWSVFGPFWDRFGSIANDFFQNVASCLHGEHNFAKRLQALSTKQIRFFALRMATKWPLKCGNVAPKSPKNDPKRLVCAKNAPSMYRISFAEMSISRLKRLVIEFRTNFDRVLTANDPKTAPKWPEATLGCPKWPQSGPKMIPLWSQSDLEAARASYK